MPETTAMLSRTVIARPLHDLVDQWLESPLLEEVGGAHMMIRITYTSKDDPDDSIALVVGSEPGRNEADE